MARSRSSSAAATENHELPADHARLELHGAALSPTRGNPGRHMEVPGGAAGKLSIQRCVTRSTAFPPPPDGGENRHGNARRQTMRRTVLATFAVVCAATAVEAQSLSADDLARRTIERRAVEAVIWGMPAVNTEIMMKGLQGQGRLQSNSVLVAPSGLEEPASHPQPRYHLLPSLLQHEGRRSDGAGDSAGQRPKTRSPAASTTPGRSRSRMSVRPASIRGRAAST